ncbi:MAG TPA: MSMEG_0569 family flavin-dependent oxidoreductase [Haloferula sp.]
MSFPEHRRTDVAIIGGGQAGLSVSYCLKQRGIHDHVIFERHCIGHSWRSERWDSFSLVTPNFQCRLPGHPYDGDEPEGFMVKDEIVAYIERYAAKVKPPIHEGVSVQSIEAHEDGFLVTTSEGTWIAAQVVMAIGGFHKPIVPPGTENIPDSIFQIHSVAYRNPEQIPEGDIVVVGSGQSGCQIAEDLHLAGRNVHLCLGNAPRSPRQYRGKDVVAWLEDMRYYDTPISAHPDPVMVRDSTNHYLTGRDGGREIDLRRFALEGMGLYGYVDGIDSEGFRLRPNLKERLDAADKSYVGIRKRIDEYIAAQGIDVPEEPVYEACWQPDEEPTRLDFSAKDVGAIIWSIGFRSDFSFVKFPVFDERGYPRYERGVTEVPGLYFIGLPWLHTWGSGRFAGVGPDAEHLADQIHNSLARKPSPELAGIV